MGPRSPPASPTTATSSPARSRTSSPAASAGTATASSSSTRSTRSLASPSATTSSAWASTSTTSAAALSAATLPSGSSSSRAPVDGSISRTIIRRWTSSTWRACGGSSRSSMRRGLFTGGSRVFDPAIMVSFPLIGDPDNAALVAWPPPLWTLPSNLALCLNENFIYVKDEGLIVAIDADGAFTEKVSDFKGRYVKDADKDMTNAAKVINRIQKLRKKAGLEPSDIVEVYYESLDNDKD